MRRPTPVTFCVDCCCSVPVEAVRDVPRGLQLTQHLAQQVPGNPQYQSLHAAALVRGGEFAQAETLLKELANGRESDVPQDWFVLCLAQVGLQRGDEARASFARGCSCMDRQAPGSIDLQRLRKEAEKSLSP
jgi:predicted Zn-dependent protease